MMARSTVRAAILCTFWLAGTFAGTAADTSFQARPSTRPSTPGAPQPAESAPQLFSEIARLREAGELADAQLVAERLVALVSARGEAAWEDQSVALNTLGQIQYTRGDIEGAAASFAEVVRLRRAHPDSDVLSLAQAVTNLAQALEADADLEGAIPLFTEALTLIARARGPAHPDLAAAAEQLGGTLLAREDYAGAAEAFERAWRIREPLGADAQPGALRAMRALARARQGQQRYDEASVLLERAVEITERTAGAQHPDLARALDQLGTLRQEQGRLDDAEPLLRRALSIREAAHGPNHRETASTLANLGRLYQALGRNDQARQHHQRALDIRRAALGDRHPDVVRTLLQLAILRAVEGDALGAVRDGGEALESAEYLHGLVLASASESRRRREADALVEVTDIAVSLHLQYAPSSVAAARIALTSVLRNKGRLVDAAESVTAATRGRLEAGGQQQLDSLRGLRRELATLVTAGPGSRSTEAHADAMVALERRIAETEATLERDHLGFRPAAAAASLDEIQARLSSDMALIEFAAYRPFDPAAARESGRFGPTRYVVYALTARGQITWADLGETDAIDEAVVEFREALRDPRRMDVVSLARRLDVLVVAPVVGKVGQARHLVVAPGGLLNLVPFAALADQRGAYRITQFRISYVSSGRDLVPQVRRDAREPALLVAAPDYGRVEAAAPGTEASVPPAAPTFALPSRAAALARGEFAPLPDTAIEARALQSLLPGAQVAVGADATEARILATAGPSVLHVAAHAWVARAEDSVAGDPGDPVLASGGGLSRVRVALAGAGQKQGDSKAAGVLAGDEVAALDLQGTSLAVFSALEPGDADASAAAGVLALRRALVVAGADSQVLSLWQVSERVTNEVMPDFYRHLRDGLPRAEALRRAQQTLASTPRTAHPHYWAPFLLSGNWREMRDAFSDADRADGDADHAGQTRTRITRIRALVSGPTSTED